MLSSLVKTHNKEKLQLQKQADQAKERAVARVQEVTDGLMDSVNTEVAHCFAQERALEAEVKGLHDAAQTFTKKTAQWLQLVDQFNTSLKEIGDIENWSRHIEDDMHVILQSLRFIHRQTYPPVEASGASTDVPSSSSSPTGTSDPQ